MLSNQKVSTPAGTGPSGKLASFEISSLYVIAPATAPQWKRMTSRGWKVEYACVGPRIGVGSVAGPAPVTTTLRAAENNPDSNAPFTACTRQKYVPGGRPLTVPCVAPFVES